MPFVIISGCSGGGKSTLLAELARRGHMTIEEPGRRIVRDELAAGGTALPWIDLRAFCERAISLGKADHEAARHNSGITFFDRSLIDAWSALVSVTGADLPGELADWRYDQTVFLTPPWPEIYVNDGERQHDMTAAEVEYHRLCRDYPALGYETVVLPKLPVAERAAFIEQRLGLRG